MQAEREAWNAVEYEAEALIAALEPAYQVFQVINLSYPIQH
jgi:hypothetical protein